MIRKLAALLLVVVLGWTYQAIQPPPPRICGTPNGPPITSPRIRLSDGRHLSYKEAGVPREKSKHRIVIIHGYDSSKDSTMPASPELVEELGIYFLSFDRAGYGESDPNPKRSVQSEAMDIQELANRLSLGLRFYVIGVSMGSFPAWGCLKYIPHRCCTGGSSYQLLVAFVPAALSREAFGKLLVQDQRTFWIAHNAPWLLHGWMTQKFFSVSAAAQGDPIIFSRQDLEIMHMLTANTSNSSFLWVPDDMQLLGVFESLHRDLLVLFGKWEFDPMELKNPFDDNKGSVQIWQGHEDRIVPFQLQRYVHQKLPWIKYHECQECGHMFLYADKWSDRVLKALLLGEEDPSAVQRI